MAIENPILNILRGLNVSHEIPKEEFAYLRSILHGQGTYAIRDIVGVAFIQAELPPDSRRRIQDLYFSSRGYLERNHPDLYEVYRRLEDEVEGEEGTKTIQHGLCNGKLNGSMEEFRGVNPEFLRIGETFGVDRILICYVMRKSQ